MKDATKNVNFAVHGMTCASCVRRVERSIAKLEGIGQVNVNLAAESVRVEILDPSLRPQIVIDTITKAGYEAKLIERADKQTQALLESRQKETDYFLRAFSLAAILTLPVFITEMGTHFFSAFHHWLHNQVSTIETLWIMHFVLTTLVLLFPGRRFFTLGFKALTQGNPDMNSLVAMGAGSAYLYSCVVLFFPDLIPLHSRALYFEAAAVVVTLILLGRYLEARSKGQTGQAISRLLDLQVKVAHIIDADGRLRDIPLEELSVGQKVLVRPGEAIPADGLVLAGEAHVNESMMTGEPIPALRTINDKVIGSTISTNGSLTVRITEVGENTVLANIVRMVQEAQADKLPIQNVLDMLTSRFVPAVLVIAALTFAAWMVWGSAPLIPNALIAAVSVLIIACPCAMGLAVPVSIMVATGRAAQLNILFRKSSALQVLKDVKAVVFDKTGTLTIGQAEVIDIWTIPGVDADEVLLQVASIEQQSEHPIALAIVKRAQADQLTLKTVEVFENRVGQGFRAVLEGQEFYIGSAQFINEQGVDKSYFEQAMECAQEAADRGATPIFVARDHRLMAIFVIADRLKEDAKQAITALHDAGIKTVMLTGDNERTAQSIASALHIDDVFAQALPTDKVDYLKQIQGEYGVTAFVGDGINDAPALAAADIGMAIGTGTDVAIESADVVLMGTQLRSVVNAIMLSRATFKNINENLFWAFAYNVALIPIAAGILYPTYKISLSPVFAATAMALSSFFVVMNALRLRGFQSKF